MSSFIVIGDVHGCLTEFRELLNLIGRTTVPIIQLGDLLDRGPDPYGCVRFAREQKLLCLRGNHEDTALRYLAWQDKCRITGQKNPMKTPHPDRRREWESLSESDLAWMRALPTTVEPAHNVICVHAGFEIRGIEVQKKDRMLRVRYIDPDTGLMVPIDENMQPPPGSVFWMERWKGPQSVIYGHAVHSLDLPREDAFEGGYTYGLDTGCVFGGHLTAALFDKDGLNPELIQVKARKVYHARLVA